MYILKILHILGRNITKRITKYIYYIVQFQTHKSVAKICPIWPQSKKCRGGGGGPKLSLLDIYM